MRILFTMIAIFVVTIFFVNVILFGILGLSLAQVSIKTLLWVEGIFGAFFTFLFFLVTKKF